MILIDEKQIEQILTDLADRGVLAISARKRRAQSGTIHLTIYPGSSEVEQTVKDYLATVDLVSVSGHLALLRYEQSFYGLDFLGEIPLFVDEDTEYTDPNSGRPQQGCEIEQGLDELQSTFEPRTRDSLEEELLAPDFAEIIQTTCETVSNQVDCPETDEPEIRGINIEEADIERTEAEAEVLRLIDSNPELLEPYEHPVENLYLLRTQTDQGSLSATIYTTDDPEMDMERVQEKVEQMANKRSELLADPTQPNDLIRAIALQYRLNELGREIQLKQRLINRSNPVLEGDNAKITASLI
jgi:hypothetical protein